ncbi:hypothetical protein PR001_g15435 [Phytophthora rubi]|uniref:Uncharacterized protein n=2 Tax=Phytophthora rubi TaxID=129364 RepID=A0A6A3L5P8_9STRA|nr:hypothetical protein PR001_g15435 [Phytophthora rubi]
MDVPDANHQDVFSNVYDFRQFVDATSWAADVSVAVKILCLSSERLRANIGARVAVIEEGEAQRVGRVRVARGEGRGPGGRRELGQGGTYEQDVMEYSTKEDDFVNATAEKEGLVKARMKAETGDRRRQQTR